MNYFQLIITNISIFLFTYLLFKKFNLFIDNTTFSIHKKIGSENNSPIVMGGIYIFLISLVNFSANSLETNLVFLLILILGLMSDNNILTNTKLRFFLQLFLVLSLVLINNLKIDDLRIIFLNELLDNYLVNIFFTTFCLMVLINGSNFIDGLNGLLCGYYIMITGSIIFIGLYNFEINFFDQNIIEIIFFSLLIFLIPNLFGKVYLGDGGSYLISTIIGYHLIKFYFINNNISPYYISLLLWYPAFENLFSLLRRVITKKDISNPDNRHLHQIIFIYLKKRSLFLKRNLNSISSAIILLFNLPGFVLANIYYDESLILGIVLISNFVMYCVIYYKMSKYLKLIN